MPGNPRPVPEEGWGSAHEAMPVCGDSEAFKWMMAYMNNTEHDMLHDGYMWMLHGDMGEDNTKAGVLNKADAEDPANWIESGAHLMRMPKDPSSLDGMTTDFRSGAPYVMFSGTPWAHLMIPVEGYYDYSERDPPGICSIIAKANYHAHQDLLNPGDFLWLVPLSYGVEIANSHHNLTKRDKII
jgi:hypothetical protein